MKENRRDSLFVPNKCPPLNIKNIENGEYTPRSIFPTHNIPPPIIRKERIWSTTNQLNPLRWPNIRPNQLLTSNNRISLASWCKLESIIDMIQARSNSDFDVKSATIQFYGNSHNSQSDCWIKLNFYVESSNMLSNLGLKF